MSAFILFSNNQINIKAGGDCTFKSFNHKKHVFLLMINYIISQISFHSTKKIMSERRSWPQLVGMPVDQAIAIIQQENPGINVVKLPENSPTTRDFRLNRVRVFHDADGNVTSEPRTG